MNRKIKDIKKSKQIYVVKKNLISLCWLSKHDNLVQELEGGGKDGEDGKDEKDGEKQNQVCKTFSLQPLIDTNEVNKVIDVCEDVSDINSQNIIFLEELKTNNIKNVNINKQNVNIIPANKNADIDEVNKQFQLIWPIENKITTDKDNVKFIHDFEEWINENKKVQIVLNIHSDKLQNVFENNDNNNKIPEKLNKSAEKYNDLKAEFDWQEELNKSDEEYNELKPELDWQKKLNNFVEEYNDLKAKFDLQKSWTDNQIAEFNEQKKNIDNLQNILNTIKWYDIHNPEILKTIDGIIDGIQSQINIIKTFSAKINNIIQIQKKLNKFNEE